MEKDKLYELALKYKQAVEVYNFYIKNEFKQRYDLKTLELRVNIQKAEIELHLYILKGDKNNA